MHALYTKMLSLLNIFVIHNDGLRYTDIRGIEKFTHIIDHLANLNYIPGASWRIFQPPPPFF